MKKNPVHEVNIVCNSLGKKEGISEYTMVLKRRFEEKNVKVSLFRTLNDVKNEGITIFEYEPTMCTELPNSKNVIVEAHAIYYPRWHGAPLSNQYTEETLIDVDLNELGYF